MVSVNPEIDGLTVYQPEAKMDDLELVARYITARKMGLVKDVYGHRLPIDLWSRYEDEARRLLEVCPKDEVMNVIELTVQPA